MNQIKVGVLGATGFVGSRLVQRLWKDLGPENVSAFIHRSGNAWDLARSGNELVSLDIMSKDDICEKLAGCSHVVNCSRGDNTVMLEGVKNILSGCQTAGVKRFVHLSSVAIHGRYFDGETITESYSTARAKSDAYGAIKLQADELVRAAAAKGLSATILCPPNISGRNSTYLLDVVKAIRSGDFKRLKNADRLPCELVDVENLVEAITLALEKGPRDGRRMFVTDQSTATWQDLYKVLAPLADAHHASQTISPEDAIAFLNRRPKYSVVSAIRRLVASDTRACLRKDPLLADFESCARKVTRQLIKKKRSPERKPINDQLPSANPGGETKWIRDQVRNVRYSGQVAQMELGFRPVFTFDESMSRFAEWYRAFYGRADGSWHLLKHLT